MKQNSGSHQLFGRALSDVKKVQVIKYKKSFLSVGHGKDKHDGHVNTQDIHMYSFVTLQVGRRFIVEEVV